VGVNSAGTTFSQVQQRVQNDASDTAAENLNQLSLNYWAESDLVNNLTKLGSNVLATRLPSAGMFSSPLAVVYNFGFPNKGYYIDRNIDIRLSRLGVTSASQQQVMNYLGLAGVAGSYFESSVQEQLFGYWQGTGLSTVQSFADANAQRIEIYSITGSNAATILGKLQLLAEVMDDISVAVSSELQVMVPQRVPYEVRRRVWVGYEIRDLCDGVGDDTKFRMAQLAARAAPCPSRAPAGHPGHQEHNQHTDHIGNYRCSDRAYRMGYGGYCNSCACSNSGGRDGVIRAVRISLCRNCRSCVLQSYSSHAERRGSCSRSVRSNS
jgi:hypothetical protein